MRKLLMVAAVISIFPIILFSSLISASYDLKYYDRLFMKHDVYSRFDRETALNETKAIHDFFMHKGELGDFFDRNEKDHLDDVRKLLTNVSLTYHMSIAVFWISIISLYLAFKNLFTGDLSAIMLLSGFISLMILLLAGIAFAAFGFDSSFLGFHKIFFTGNYAFDPETSNMKAMFPDGFFMDMASRIYLSTIGKSALLLLAGLLMRKKKNKKGA